MLLVLRDLGVKERSRDFALRKLEGIRLRIRADGVNEKRAGFEGSTRERKV